MPPRENVPRPASQTRGVSLRLARLYDPAVSALTVAIPKPDAPPARAEALPVASLRNVTVLRDGRAAVRDVWLDVPAARTLALVGPNGGGKTSLLRAVLGLLPYRGEIVVGGLSPRRATRRGDVVGYVPQRPAVPAGLPITARQAVRLAVAGRSGFLKRARPADLEWADAMLARVVGDESLDDLPVTRLSGGQLQQVFLARALANRPRLLLLDEPTVGLDRPAVSRLVALLRGLQDELGLATLIATHDHLTAMAVADELAYLDRTVRYRGPVDSLPPELDSRLCHHDHAV